MLLTRECADGSFQLNQTWSKSRVVYAWSVGIVRAVRERWSFRQAMDANHHDYDNKATQSF